jgi:alcohol oxidase
VAEAETYDIEPTKVSHGDSGPLHVTYGGDVFDVGKQYIDIGSKFEKDRPQSDEGSDFTADSINKFFVRVSFFPFPPTRVYSP